MRDPIELLEVDLELGVGGGALRIGGREVPYTGDGVRIQSGLDGAPTLNIETIAFGGRVHGFAAVTYEVSYIDSRTGATWPKAQGPTVPAALRALADAMEANS